MSRGRRSRDRGYISGNRTIAADILHAEVNYLVVAGGGGGGGGNNPSSSRGAGGGGAGGMKTGVVALLLQTYTVTVGGGGNGGGVNGSGSNGSNSGFSTITTTGGGGGARQETNGASGGSGGGGGDRASGANGFGGAGTSGEGNAGGNGSPALGGGGGGGGASAAGTAGSDNGGTGGSGAGGSGSASSISGSSVTYAAGGAGGNRGTGGVNPGAAAAGTTNRGNGGTGSTGGIDGVGGAGGSGVVILRYSNLYTLNIGAGLSFSTQTVDDDKVTTFTGGSGSISLSSAPVTTGDYESIATVLVGSAGASSVTFSNIPQTYKHLQLRIIARTTFNLTEDYLSMRFNGDSGANYTYHNLYTNAGAAVAGGGSGQTLAYLQRGTGATAPASTFGTIIVDIPDYANVSKNKTFKMFGGWETNAAGAVYLDSGAWVNTNAISSVQIFGGNASSTLVQYSHFALYGIRG